MNDDDGDDLKLYNDTQNRALSLIPRFTAPLSLLGSLLIIYVIVKHRRRHLLQNSYDRIILGLSIFDAVSSFGYAFFGAWSIPEGTPYVVGARASNTILCDINGFLLHMAVGSIFYTTSLMVYFILLVKMDWRPSRIAKLVEPWLHGVSIAFPLVSGAYAVSQGYMEPLRSIPGVCWIGRSIPECTNNNDLPACPSRSEEQDKFAVAVLGGTSSIVVVIVVVAMILLISKVRSVEMRMERYNQDFARGSPGATMADRTAINTASFARTRRTAKRGLAYIAAFSLCYVPSIIHQVGVNSTGATLKFILTTLIVLFYPMQGLFNSVIYLFPQHNGLFRQGLHHVFTSLRRQSFSLLRSSFVLRSTRFVNDAAPPAAVGTAGTSVEEPPGMMVGAVNHGKMRSGSFGRHLHQEVKLCLQGSIELCLAGVDHNDGSMVTVSPMMQEEQLQSKERKHDDMSIEIGEITSVSGVQAAEEAPDHQPEQEQEQYNSDVEEQIIQNFENHGERKQKEIDFDHSSATEKDCNDVLSVLQDQPVDPNNSRDSVQQLASVPLAPICPAPLTFVSHVVEESISNASSTEPHCHDQSIEQIGELAAQLQSIIDFSTKSERGSTAGGSSRICHDDHRNDKNRPAPSAFDDDDDLLQEMIDLESNEEMLRGDLEAASQPETFFWVWSRWQQNKQEHSPQMN